LASSRGRRGRALYTCRDGQRPMLIGARRCSRHRGGHLNLTPASERLSCPTRGPSCLCISPAWPRHESILAIAERGEFRCSKTRRTHTEGPERTRPRLHRIGGDIQFPGVQEHDRGEGGLITTDDPAVAELCDSYIWRAARSPARVRAPPPRLELSDDGIPGGDPAPNSRGWRSSRTRFANGLCLNAHWRGSRASAPGHPRVATRHAFHIYALRFDAFPSEGPRYLPCGDTAEGIPCSSGYASPSRNPMFAEM
jgi:hypothetical protein